MERSAVEVQKWLADHDPLTVVPLRDEIVERLGFSPDDTYVETYWLPIVGPTALWALRRFTGWLASSPSGVTVPIAPLARELGLGHRGGAGSPAIRSVARLVMFGLADIRNGSFAVRVAVPPLARRQLRHLPGHLAERHSAEREAPARNTTGASR